MTDAQYISPLDQARILSEALPHMQQYDEEKMCIRDRLSYGRVFR